MRVYKIQKELNTSTFKKKNHHFITMYKFLFPSARCLAAKYQPYCRVLVLFKLESFLRLCALGVTFRQPSRW